MKLPTREEINIHDSLDERSACENFLGKTLNEAEVFFQENFSTAQEDLMWMGPVAFRFYAPAAIRYLQSEKSRGDSDAINCFVGLLEFRWGHEPGEIRPIASELAVALRYVVDNYGKFESDFDIYDGLRSRCEQLMEQLQKQK